MLSSLLQNPEENMLRAYALLMERTGIGRRCQRDDALSPRRDPCPTIHRRCGGRSGSALVTI